MRGLLAATTDAHADGAVEVAAGLALVAAAATAAAAVLAPGAGVLDVLACAKFYLGQGCLP
jgi:hypothetical protein